MNRMKRWPIIRHVRWLNLSYGYWKWWHDIGHVLGAFPNPADMQYLQDVWEGRK